MGSFERFTEYNLQDFLLSPNRMANDVEAWDLAGKEDIFHSMAENAKAAGYTTAVTVLQSLAHDVGARPQHNGSPDFDRYPHTRDMLVKSLAQGVFEELTTPQSELRHDGIVIATHKSLQEYWHSEKLAPKGWPHVVMGKGSESSEGWERLSLRVHSPEDKRVKSKTNLIRAVLGVTADDSEDTETTPERWNEFGHRRFEAQSGLGVTLITERFMKEHTKGLLRLSVKKQPANNSYIA